MAKHSLVDILADLHLTQESFLNILNQTGDEALYRRPAEDSWTLAETLVHIAEARQFFAAEIKKGLTMPGVRLGRTAENRNRLQNITDHGHDNLDLIRQKIIVSYENMVKTLDEMTDNDLQIKVNHVQLGSQTLAEFIQRFLVGHDQMHVEQARTLLSGESASG